MSEKPKHATLVVQLPTDLHALVADAARQEGNSVSAFTRRVQLTAARIGPNSCTGAAVNE